MPRSTATTVEKYLETIPPDRRAEIARVRDLVREHLPKGYEETMSGGMIAWVVPQARLPKTYNNQPLWYAGLAAQKNFCTLYLMSAYGDAKQLAGLKAAFAKAGKKFDMGKSCLHFKRADDLALDAVAGVIASTPMERWAQIYEESRRR